jgi:hypothetical protein
LIANKTINTSEKVQAIGSLIKQSPHLTHLDVANNFGGLTVDFKESSSQFKRDMKFGEEFWKILLTQDSFPSLTYFNCQGNRASLQKSHIIDVLGKMPNLKILEMAYNGEILTEISTISLPSTDITTFLANIQELRFNRTFLFKADLLLTTLYLNGCNLSQDRNKVVSFIGNYSSSLQTVTLRDNQLGNEILQEIIDIIHKEQQSRNIVNCVQLDVRENPEIAASKITNYNTNHVSVRFN